MKEVIPEPEIFSVDGHQIRGYELLKRTVSRANKYAGRIILPVGWIGRDVKVVLDGEVYDDYVKPGVNQGRLNAKSVHIGKIAWIIRVEPQKDTIKYS